MGIGPNHQSPKIYLIFTIKKIIINIYFLLIKYFIYPIKIFLNLLCCIKLFCKDFTK